MTTTNLTNKILDEITENGVSYTRITDSHYQSVVNKVRNYLSEEGVRVIFENLNRGDFVYRIRLRKNTWTEGVRN